MALLLFLLLLLIMWPVVAVSVVAAAVTAAAACGYGLLTRQVAHAAVEWKTTGSTNSRPPATHRVGKVEGKKNWRRPFPLLCIFLYLDLENRGESFFSLSIISPSLGSPCGVAFLSFRRWITTQIRALHEPTTAS
jgi:hypothetical protein